MSESIIAEIDVEISRLRQDCGLLVNGDSKGNRHPAKITAKVDQLSGRKKRG